MEPLSSQTQEIALANAVLCPAQAVARKIANRSPNTAIISLGITLPSGQQGASDTRTTASDMGRFSDIQGTQEFIDAMQQVIADRPEVRVLIAGGLSNNAPAAQRWHTRINESLPSAELTERLTPVEVAALNPPSPLVVVLNGYDTLGLSTLEGDGTRGGRGGSKERWAGRVDDTQRHRMIGTAPRRQCAECVCFELD